ncbi:hypothetical protein [Ochrobactrum sp. Marseille-Q0166]|uniref:hypothetical protein n=1 Tax=Ochrobactrum sp. Marseille-Q0166 TaxID=2761105 RepID=UPI0016550542|nr:hypothetical protein [Ochrobactrum sp. Marseille-Q0166]MBC8719638.1 hypothetical protein [Ochrobactrum sp. Marseille-Q0166]
MIKSLLTSKNDKRQWVLLHLQLAHVSHRHEYEQHDADLKIDTLHLKGLDFLKLREQATDWSRTRVKLSG